MSTTPENLPNITCDDAYYQAGLDHWASIRDTIPDMIKYFQENIGYFVQVGSDSDWRMLSVGCGEGFVDIPILNLITAQYPDLKIAYEGLDCSALRLDRCQEAARQKVASSHRLIFHHTDFEHYPDPENEHDRFDLVLCARVLYYMHDRLDSTLARLFEKCLTPKSGKILIFHQSPSGLAQIAHIVGMKNQSTVHSCNTYHLRLALDRISSGYPSLDYRILYLDKYTDMSFLQLVCSNDLVERNKGILLLSFILGKKLADLDQTSIEQIVERILSAVTFETAVNKQHIMFQPIGVVIVENRSTNL